MKILVVDDEELLVKGIRFNLQNEGYEVITGANGVEAVESARQNAPDLIILDVMMPEMDGMTACARIREFSNVPIILLTAKTDDMDKLMGFDHGADDYVTKPFSLAVLMRRVESLLQRGAVQIPTKEKKDTEDIEIAGLIIKPVAHEVSINNIPVELTVKEFKILLKMCKHQGIVYSRDKLLDEIWGLDYIGDIRTVDSHVARLRTKLGEWGNNNIVTIYGSGYKVNK